VCHPNIYSAVEALQTEEVTSGAEYYRALLGMKPGPRKKLYVTKDGTYGAYKELLTAGDITIDVYMKRVVGMLIITKKKVMREGVEQQNISSSDQSDESEDDAGTSDDSQVDLVEGVSFFVVTQRCDFKSKCKTRRCPCVLGNNSYCHALCHTDNQLCRTRYLLILSQVKTKIIIFSNKNKKNNYCSFKIVKFFVTQLVCRKTR
jgi:hypothetical protein